MMSEFDAKARDWDKNIMNHERALAIATQLKERAVSAAGMKVMEFGAGTALLSFILREQFSSITLVDTSPEMIRVCREKISETGSDTIQAILLDLEKEPFDDKFNLIYSQMAFHHVADIGGIIRKLHALLNDKGTLAVADLYPEDGSFHGEGFTGHLGIDPDWFSEQLIANGFSEASYRECFIQKKMDADGNVKEYPVFLMIANKQ